MRATKLVNKKLLISFSIQAFENADRLNLLGEERLYEKRLAAPALNGIGVFKNSTDKVFMWW